jgi:hypothetical protein
MHSLLGTGAIPDRHRFFLEQFQTDVPSDVRMFDQLFSRLPEEQHGYALTVPLNKLGQALTIAIGKQDMATLLRGGMDRLGGDTSLASWGRALEETAVAEFHEGDRRTTMVRKALDMIGIEAKDRAAAPFRPHEGSNGLPGGLGDLLQGGGLDGLFGGKGAPKGLEELFGRMGQGGSIDDLMRGAAHLRA